MFTKTFKQINKNDTSIAGGKGASLGEMTNAKISVPSGFVILANAFEKFLQESDIGVEINSIISKVNLRDINSMEGVSVKMRNLVSNAKIPADINDEILKEYHKLKSQNTNLLVAVRSSATAEDSPTASWAGELETYLNVTERNLIKSVKKCWASLFTPRAIFYRHEKNLHQQKVSVAVVVQAMIQSEISGICFTVHPVTKDQNQMVIEAGYGLGEAIVGGKITPDTYIIRKPMIKNQKPKILDKNVSRQKMMIIRKEVEGIEEVKVPELKREKQKLSNKQTIELAKLCIKIESHYQFPQDIEWCLKSGKIYITQSRPITTL